MQTSVSWTPCIGSASRPSRGASTRRRRMRPERLIRANPPRVEADNWTIVEGASADVRVGRAIVPLATWKAHRDTLAKREAVGVWLAPDDDPESLRCDLAAVSVIAVHFPKA